MMLAGLAMSAARREFPDGSAPDKKLDELRAAFLKGWSAGNTVELTITARARQLARIRPIDAMKEIREANPDLSVDDASSVVLGLR